MEADGVLKQISFFGFQLWIVIGIFVVVAFLLLSVSTLICFVSRRKPINGNVINDMIKYPTSHLISIPPTSEKSNIRSSKRIPLLDWPGGYWYNLKELEDATDGFSDKNKIGEGEYGSVYVGVLKDHTQVAIKILLSNTTGQAEIADSEFKVEVEAIGQARHKNLVRLLGYCVQHLNKRMVVYEYMDNGNLEQWIHEERIELTWDHRMNIILGTAKGLTYMHQGLEPKVIHRNIKSGNILLNKSWTPKISDFGLAKLMGEHSSAYVTTRVMGTFGYVAPEYAQTGMLNDKSDIYSFGILIMEIVSGRKPVDYNRPPGEVNLVEWVKLMVNAKNCQGVIDPKLNNKPSARELDRILLVALRCVHPDSTNRPKMERILNMLETHEFPF